MEKLDDIIFRLCHAQRCVSPSIYSDSKQDEHFHILVAHPKTNKEVPLCVTLTNYIQSVAEADTLVIHLKPCGHSPYYTSNDAKIRALLSFWPHGTLGNLLAADFDVGEGRKVRYYGVHGCIFDSNMYPIFTTNMRIENNEGTTATSTLVFNIDPLCYQKEQDCVTRFITGKLINTIITGGYTHRCCIEIKECPYSFNSVTRPSVNTTDEELLRCAYTYCNEMFDYPAT